MAPPGAAMIPGTTVPGQTTGMSQAMPGMFPNMFPFGNAQFGGLPVMPVQAMTQQATRHAGGYMLVAFLQWLMSRQLLHILVGLWLL